MDRDDIWADYLYYFQEEPWQFSWDALLEEYYNVTEGA